MNTLDIVVISIVGLSALVAGLRGFVREMIALVGWVAAAVMVAAFYDEGATALKSNIENPLIAKAVAGVLIFVLTMIVFAILGSLISRVIRTGGFSAIDRSLGLLFGLARGAFLISLLFLTVQLTVGEKQYPEWLKQARTYNLMAMGAETLTAAAPGMIQELDDFSQEAKATTETVLNSGGSDTTKIIGAIAGGAPQEPLPSEKLSDTHAHMMERVLAALPDSTLPKPRGANVRAYTPQSLENLVRAYRQSIAKAPPPAPILTDEEFNELERALKELSGKGNTGGLPQRLQSPARP